jgi:hypothetical protein
MATPSVPLNTFLSRAFELTTQEQTLYTCPQGFSAIVLGSQASNIGTQSATVTFTMIKNNVDYVLLKEFEIPPNDAAEVTTGKLILEQGVSVKAVVSADSTINLVLSILESSNE